MSHLPSALRAAGLASFAILVLPAHLPGQQPAPPGRIIAVDGVRFHLNCQGQGSPTFVVENGAGGWSIAWSGIQDSMAQSVRFCTFDRAGHGWSGPSPAPRRASIMVDELHGALHTAGESGPFVLVGHSFGGYLVRIYADRYPTDVGGIALVESAQEDQWTKLPPEVNAFIDAGVAQLEQAARAVDAGMVRPEMLPPHPVYNQRPDWDSSYRAVSTTPAHYQALIATIQLMPESVQDLRTTGSLGDLPLLVISAGNSFGAFLNSPIPQPAANTKWMELQRRLVKLSTRSRHVIDETATHNINWDNPALIVQELRILADTVRDRSTGASTPDRVTMTRTLDALTAAYTRADADAFAAQYTLTMEHQDVVHRQSVKGRAAWHAFTKQVFGAHKSLALRHLRRAYGDDWVAAEVEWNGIIDGPRVGLAADVPYHYRGIVLYQFKGDAIHRQTLYIDGPTADEQLKAIRGGGG